MQSKQITPKTKALFVFEALLYGLNSGLVEKSFIKTFRRDCAGMTFVLAKKYYNVVFEANLKQAAHCVLGVLNLGLLECSGGSLPEAAVILAKEGALKAFREGWTRIDALSCHEDIFEKQLHKSRFEREKDFAELFSACPGQIWTGHRDYLAHRIFLATKRN